MCDVQHLKPATIKEKQQKDRVPRCCVYVAKLVDSLFDPLPQGCYTYFLRKLRRVKKGNGQVLAINEIFEKRPTVVQNYGLWVRYMSRTGTHNMYKEYRDVTLNGAVEQLYSEMASRHRVRAPQLHIIKTATVKPSESKREGVMQFHDSKIKFPLTRKMARPSHPQYKSTFKAARPSVGMF